MNNQSHTSSNPPAQPRRWRSIVIVVLQAGLGALAGAGMGFTGATLAETADIQGSTLLLLVPVFVLLFFLVLLVHECGHLIGGKLAGFRFALLIVGPLKIIRQQHSLHIGLNTSPALWGGLASSIPADTRNLRRRMMLMTAGGPIASLVLALVTGVLALALPRPNAIVPILLLGFTAVVSLLIFAVTMIPSRFGFLSDGARLLMLWREGPLAERWCALAALYGASRAGQRPRDWNTSLLEQAVALHDGTLDAAGAYGLAYAHALDRGEVQQAGALLDRALEVQLPNTIRASFLTEAAYFVARHHGDAATAHMYLAQAKGSLVDAHTRARAQAAVLLAENKPEQAAAMAREAQSLLYQTWDTGSARAEFEWIDDLLAQAALVAPSTVQ